MICRCGKTYGDTEESRLAAAWSSVPDPSGQFRMVACSMECLNRCSFCGGPAHPATGHEYSSTCIACTRCYREHLPWLQSRFRNPIAEAAVRQAGTLIVGEWTAEDEVKSAKARGRRKKNRVSTTPRP